MMKTSHERIANALELYLRELPASTGTTVVIAGTMEAAPRERVARFCRESRITLHRSELLPGAALKGLGDVAAVVLLGVEAREVPAQWQPMLRRDGLLLLETTGGGALRFWRSALGQGGFFRVRDHGRADQVSSASEPGLILAHSTGPRKVATPAAPPKSAVSTPKADANGLRALLAAELGGVLQLSVTELDPAVPFTEFGLDSVLGVVFINRVNAVLGVRLKPTVLFDYASLEGLSGYLATQSVQLPAEPSTPEQKAEAVAEPSRQEACAPTSAPAAADDIAVIGIAGRFPGADDVEAFWRDIAAGVDRVVGVPEGRWNGGMERRGGFMNGVEHFDPLFFRISGREAEATDPQQRLFLEACYHALENSGYTGAGLASAGRCGVFAGVEPGDYLHLLLKREREEKSPVFQGNAESILAARIAYFLDLKGPALAVNTACSSSLVAIHLACRALASGECETALAGGVRVYASEQAYGALGNMGMLSPDARCKTFDATADGFVPGEAVGVLLLKPLAAALRDDDRIWGVIKGSAINQDGRTNGITAPSSLAQTEVEQTVYRRFHLDPTTFQYVEAHGTGTRLGDPIEIQALSEAFRPYGVAPQSCAIGSVKTNIGHTMAAAGVVSVIKVLMAMKYRQLPPSLHLDTLNPLLEMEQSPFRVQTALTSWEAPEGQPRRAAVSSFGFSGTNSHLVLEEAPACERTTVAKQPARLFLLSARTRDALDLRLKELLGWLRGEGRGCALADLAYTLHHGREHFEERCAFLAGTAEELESTLTALVEQGKRSEQVWLSSAEGTPKEDALHREMLASLEADLAGAVPAPVYRQKLAALGALYALGYLPDHEALFPGRKPRRAVLPGYPFARERYWVPLEATAWHPMFPSQPQERGRLETRWEASQWFLKQHQVHQVPTLPGVAYLELAAVLAGLGTSEPRQAVVLEKVDWLRPLRVETGVEIAAVRREDGFEVISASDPTVVYARGQWKPASAFTAAKRDIAAIRERCRMHHDANAFHTRCEATGLQLGAAFRSWEEGWFSEEEGLIRFSAQKTGGGWHLHPGVMDGGIQAGALLAAMGGGLPVPFALERVTFPLRRDLLEPAAYAYVRRAVPAESSFEVVWLDAEGNELARIEGMQMRAIRPVVASEPEEPTPELPVESAVSPANVSHGKREILLEWLIEAFAEQVKLPRERIIPSRALEHYGLDSIMVVDFTTRLERDLGPLSRTLLFEHQTLDELADHLTAHHELPPALRVTPAPEVAMMEEAPVSDSAPMPVAADEPIAIIGMTGRFPKADDLDAFWDLLSEGRDAIEEIPASRWDYRLFYDTRPGQPGKTRNRWGGFLDGMERFDPMFFAITPREAMALDPQERLFLETAWRTVEDAGYRRSALAGRQVGVYVGVMYGEYQLYGAGNPAEGVVYPLNSSYASIANRVSYLFNWHGPSLALDTMCSSSIMAIHLACQSLRLGECEMALAGGVNTTLHPHKDMLLAPGGFAASDGRCHSFGEGGDGYVPGEGVGAVLLKPLSRALADGDVIHGVIRATAVNHGGKTNGYTVPNPKAQTALIRQALQRAGVDHLQVIEAHGTGTPLGDPIEIAALQRAFEGTRGQTEPCWIGSVKSNIGHLEAAAGMAGLAKLVLQMRHGAVAPSLHSGKLNPHIPFASTPFRVPQKLEVWERGNEPRRAGLSSFGAGGANAHLILEEAPERTAESASGQPVLLLLLSARKDDRLLERARQLLGYLEEMAQGKRPGVALEAVARTLQAGREPMAERLAWVAGNLKDAIAGLKTFIVQGATARHYRARAEEITAPAPAADASLEVLAAYWVKGGAVDWEARFPSATWQRVSLPSYPFFGERYWAPDEMIRPTTAPAIVKQVSEPFGEALCLKPVWVEKRLEGPSATPMEGALLLLYGSAELAAGLRALHPQLNVVSSAQETSEEALTQLVREVTPRWVVLQAQEGLETMILLSRALMRHGGRVDLLFVHRGEPIHAAAGALARTISYEAPAVQWRVVEAGELRAEEVQRELTAPEAEREIRLVGGRREVLQLAEHQFPEAVEGKLREGGVYLITGGLGGVGRHLARYLAERYHARLVLTGRSAPDRERLAELAALEQAGAGAAIYLQGDITTDARKVIDEVLPRFGSLNGVFHAAGVLRDGLLIRKPMDDFATVFAPKVDGTRALDEATREVPLDFLALFSSTAGIFGNAGQSDYAASNAFLDAFARWREARRTRGERHGRTVSINWPYWAEGGMNLSESEIAARLGRVGMAPLPTDAGMRLLEAILAGDEPQIVPLWGEAGQLRETFLSAPEQVIPPKSAEIGETGKTFATEMLAFLTQTLSDVTAMPIDALDPRERFEAFGVDSIVVNDFNLRLEQSFGLVPKTLLYEYPTLRELSVHLSEAYPELCRQKFSASVPAVVPVEESPEVVTAEPATAPVGDIAIIGLAGRYPKAPDLTAFWELLRSGGDAVTEVPGERWNAEALYDADPEKAAEGKIYARWGAFLDGVDRFDPLFFRIAPLEAELIDPQERLMLEVAWQTLEDAGYTRHDLQRWREGEAQANVGVFIGATTWSYDAVSNEESHRLPTSLPWSLANRLSYFFNFNGPSMPVDTACSSSLTAIHLACEAIRSGQCLQAIAGGVNLYLHPSKYRNLCMARMLAGDGKCRSFGKGGSGFVPGEGVGAVLLKPLHLAIADGDPIHGVIKGSAVNHGGFTNGYTVPSPAAQGQLVAQAWKNGGVDPATVSYLEAHGTGTALGDPIEAEGLARALGERAVPCGLGSVKSNIGHLEAAAGIAGLTKVLLQMRHGELVPTLHCEEPNPAIDWAQLPLSLVREVTPWKAATLRAGISSFGAGGANAHVVVEAWQAPARTPEEERPELIVLSARRRETFPMLAERLALHLEAHPQISLAETARTLQLGREALEHRVAWIARSRTDLLGQLRAWSRTDGATPAFALGESRVRRFEPTGEGERITSPTPGEWERVGKLWLEGQEIHWASAWHGKGVARTVPLPGYPFAGDRCWIPQQGRIRFDATHPVLRDHQVGGVPILPGAAILELTRQELAREGYTRLRQIVWQRPVKGSEAGVDLRLSREVTANGLTFEWRHPETGEVHAQGRADRGVLPAERVNLDTFRVTCRESISTETLYGQFTAAGMHYGPGFRVVRRLSMGEGCFYSELETAESWSGFGIHPGLIDGAFQSLAALGAGEGGLAIPFALEQFTTTTGELSGRCFAVGRREGNRFDLMLTNEAGEVMVQMQGLTLRPYGAQARPPEETSDAGKAVYLRPSWKGRALAPAKAWRGQVAVAGAGAPEMIRALERAGVECRPEGQTGGMPDAVVFCVPSVVRDAGAESLESGLFAFHRLVKEWHARSSERPRLIFCYPTGGNAQAFHEAVGGYVRSLRQEEPRWVVQTLGVSPDMGDPASAILAELAVEGHDIEVRYSGEGRQVREIEQWEPTGATALPWRRGGVYLITGGLGGVGRLLAGYLWERYDARLVLAGRSAPDAQTHAWLAQCPGEVIAVQADITQPDGAERAVSAALEQFGALHGVIHGAGVLRDQRVCHAGEEELRAVLAPKVAGWLALERATRHLPLELTLFLASTAGVLGNAGQAGYAFANAYLDAVARIGSGARRIVAIDWPFWEQGGMQTSPEALLAQRRKLGLHPLKTAAAWQAMEAILASGAAQGGLLYGEEEQITGWLLAPPVVQAASPAAPLPQRQGARAGRTKALEAVKQAVARVLRLDVSELDAEAELGDYGFDSITFTTLANDLNAAHALELTPALFFEYPTLGALAGYLQENCFQEQEPVAESVEVESTPVSASAPVIAAPLRESEPERGEAFERDPVAIIAMSGVFPGATDLEQFWAHLEAGDDLITRAGGIRLETWRAAGGTGEPPWGGFIDAIDQFDAALFDLSPREAALMDPQQRLFLQAIWRALEDGGYRRGDVAGSRTGVFVGVAANDYSHLLAVGGVPVEAYSATGNAHSVLANRASYFFDLRGPSEAIDTACSSSLVAIHRAVEAIGSGSCDMAFAGGVNVLLGMGAFEAFTKAGMLCEDGRCKTFDAAANGYVRGEGVGVLLLKRLSHARRDGDRIHGILRGSAENHGGRVQSLTVPNPNAQADVLRDAYERAGIDPRTISLLEAHGTGTSLGDPIEINGLRKAWSGWTDTSPVAGARCAVGSVKTQIGHLETAAGIAGVIKVLLAMRHGVIPGNVHLTTLNPYINVEGTPFHFPQASQPWEPLRDAQERAIPLRAGVSSFGFGGSNAHLVLEEAPQEEPAPLESAGPELLLLSARDRERLKELARATADWEGDASLAEIATLLQTGRDAMEERLAIIASSPEAFRTALRQFVAGVPGDYLAGAIHENRAALSLLREVHGDDDATITAPLLANREWNRLARLWVSGVEVVWPRRPVRRVTLPGYPFAPTRFWVPKSPGAVLAQEQSAPIHPLLHAQASRPDGFRFTTRLTGSESVLADHQVGGRGLLPAAAILEMAAAAQLRTGRGTAVALHDVVFLRPVGTGDWGLEVTRQDEGQAWGLTAGETVHARGRAVSLSESAPGAVSDLAALRARCPNRVEPEALYAGFAERGLVYGPAFRVVEELVFNRDEAMASLCLPEGWDGYGMPPALLDGAFQSVAVLDPEREAALPFALERLTFWKTLPARCVAIIRTRETSGQLRSYDLTLTTPEGEVLVQMEGYAIRKDGESSSPSRPPVTQLEEPRPSRGVVPLLPKLITAFAELTGMEAAAIRSDETLERYGFDSIMAVEFSETLERDFGSLPKTLLFEYPTLDALAEWLQEHRPQQPKADPSLPASAAPPASVVIHEEPASAEEASEEERDIAIIGIAGRYPQAETLDAFWRNLVGGRDCIEAIPGDRWDYRLYYDPEGKRPGSSTNRWGGFLREVDHFDPLFFNISPREAEIMDPQERLFLQTVWNTVENAGYAPGQLKGKAVGVYVGVMYGQYQLFGVEESLRRGVVTPLSSSFASIANRVSYHFDWRGPSLALDAMCSSSLLSIHLACESLRRAESELAVAGGINLILHPHKDVGLSQGGFLNREGRCRSFGTTQGRGYIPGEGVGAVLLKPLRAALREGDLIHGVIKASSINHGGHTSGYGFPNPQAQSALIRGALERAGIEPSSINYIEAAATGSSLGDPLEIAALSRVFGSSGRCSIGSVKSNIGHLESASGIAGLTKVLLQMRHRTLVPSIHTEELNPEVAWSDTPFAVQRELGPWESLRDSSGHVLPLRAGINAFGAGGSNAHVVVEAPPQRQGSAKIMESEQLIVLSARDEAALRRRVEALAGALSEGENFADLAATLAYGREPMRERLAWVVRNAGELRAWLMQWLRDGREGYRGQAGQGSRGVAEGSDLHAIARAWVVGGPLPAEPRSWRRVELPGYPFVGERCWFTVTPGTPAMVAALETPVASSAVKGHDGVRDGLRNELAAILKLAPERIDPAVRLVEYGLDSMTSLALLDKVHEGWALQLPPAVLFDHPTLEALSAYVESRIPRQAPAPKVSVVKRPSLRQVALAPADYLFAGPNRFAMSLFLAPGKRLDGERLRGALEEVSESFFPIRSRLARHGRDGWLLRECAEGVDFQEMEMAENLRCPIEGDPGSFAPFAEAFAPLKREDRQARFRVYQLKDETLIGVTLSHAVADGYSLYYLLSAWAGASRGEGFLEPRHDRQRLSRLASQALARQGRKRGEEPQWSFPHLARKAHLFASKVKTFYFHAEEELAAALAGSRQGLRNQLSENSVLTALTWKTYAEALAVSPGTMLTLCVPMDYRRLSPALSPAFFGNGAVPAMLELPKEEVLGLDLAKLASRIANALRACDEKRLAHYQAAMLALRRGSGGRDGLSRRALVDPSSGLIVTNVARFPLPSLDFGAGSEMKLLTPVHYAGTAVISDARRSGEVKVELALPSQAEAAHQIL